MSSRGDGGWGGSFLISHISFSCMGTRGVAEDGLCGRVSVGQRDVKWEGALVGLFLARSRTRARVGANKDKRVVGDGPTGDCRSMDPTMTRSWKGRGTRQGYQEKEGQLYGGSMAIVVQSWALGGGGRDSAEVDEYGYIQGIVDHSFLPITSSTGRRDRKTLAPRGIRESPRSVLLYCINMAQPLVNMDNERDLDVGPREGELTTSLHVGKMSPPKGATRVVLLMVHPILWQFSYSDDVGEAISKSQLAQGRLPRSASFQGVACCKFGGCGESQAAEPSTIPDLRATTSQISTPGPPFSPLVPSLPSSPTINRPWETYAQTLPPPVPDSPPNPSQDEPLGRRPVGLSRRRALEAGGLSPTPFGLANGLLVPLTSR